VPQFLIRPDDLENIYSCLKAEGDTASALTLLSQPEEEIWPRERIFNDVLILEISDQQLEELISAIAEESASASLLVTLTRSIKKGLATRDEEDEEEDEPQEIPFVPGAPGHPLNEDGSPREMMTIEGYCVACKDLKTFTGNVAVSESGRRMVMGYCPDCRTRMNKIDE